MSATDETLQAMATARMAPASIAMVLGGGWTAARVTRRLAQLAEPPASPSPSPCPEKLLDLARAAYSPPVPPPVAQPSLWARTGIGARKLRFCRWFIAAGWRLAEVAQLFDVEPGDLAGAMADE